MFGRLQKLLRRIFSNYSTLVSIVDLLLLVGILYFGAKGSLILIFQTTEPMRAVASGSMEPKLSKGDLIILRGYDDVTEVQSGDIIVFSRPEHLDEIIVHRICDKIHLDSQIVGFKTKGDARSNEDDWIVEFRHIKGKVVYSIPYLGYPSLIV